MLWIFSSGHDVFTVLEKRVPGPCSHGNELMGTIQRYQVDGGGNELLTLHFPGGGGESQGPSLGFHLQLPPALPQLQEILEDT